MKKIILLVLTLWAFTANAQSVFQNAGFESWNESSPSNWNTLSIMSTTLCDISKSAVSNSGDFAVKIAPQQLPPAIAAFIGVDGMVVPGLLTNATINMTAITSALSSGQLNFDNNTLISVFSNGVQLNEKPASVDGFISWNPIDETKESVILGTYVISNQSGTREVIGMGAASVMIGTNGTYAPFKASIIYQDEQKVPTELIFITLVNSLDSNASSFGYLLLDDVSITPQVGLENISADSKKLPFIFPNPTNGDFKLNVTNEVEISVYNQLGQVIIPQTEYTPNKTLSLKEKGVYFVRIKDSKGFKTQKLVVK
ncbi:MAG: T9SS type A sorting domain-containing protein [Bacteroidales bacterium]|nr:T9SS type A sorting domain-containing protein [Bacteroidales bacterium]MDD4702896.1 T9SS type A sorting domain-containing protein [Bacteroidales bacterium]